jgi:hypothetical protein
MPRAAITRPASAGPVANASACIVEAIVTARGNVSRGTSVGRSAARAGAVERPGDRGERDGRVEDGQAGRAGRGRGEEQSGADQRDALCPHHHLPPLVGVGDRAADEHQGRDGQELDEADQTEMKRGL